MHNILYIGEKWHDMEPIHGIVSMNLPDVLESTGLVKCQWFAIDEFYMKYRRLGDDVLVKLCQNNKFDFIILNWNGGDLNLNPCPNTLDILAHKMNIPMIGIWWDTVYKDSIRQAEILLDFVRFHIVVDGCFISYVVDDPSRYISLWAPVNPELFHNIEEKDRDIPVSFLGRAFRPGVNRVGKINFLLNSGIDVFYAGGQRHDLSVPIEEYASLMRRSKISLSFPTGEGISQLHGRTIEITSSGSLLLEEINIETLRLFEPMIDYIPFHTNIDMFAKVQYFMNNNEERIRIAQNGYKKTIQYYNNKVFLKQIIEKLRKYNAL